MNITLDPNNIISLPQAHLLPDGGVYLPPGAIGHLVTFDNAVSLGLLCLLAGVLLGFFITHGIFKQLHLLNE